MEEKDENIIINEQDLFNFIFYPESLSADKNSIIAAEKTLIEALDFYKQLKINSNREHSDSLKKLIAKKILAYSFSNVISLYPLKVPTTERKKENRLAAGSIDLAPKMTTKTFVDNEKEYLIKVLSYEEATKIFVFSTNDEVVKNFDIIIEPQNLKFHFEDNTEPLKINQMIDVEKIQISFSK
jgi:hypothetical protein